MGQPLEGRVAVVTGASRGIGKGIAVELGANGATVYVTGRTTVEGGILPGTVGQTAKEIDELGGQGIALACDHRDDEAVVKVFEQVRAEHVGQAFREGDAVASEILNEIAFLLTVWLGNIVDLLEPDVMIIGGGAGAMLRPFFSEMQERLPSWCVNSHCQEIPLLLAHYGGDAGIAGGAALCR